MKYFVTIGDESHEVEVTGNHVTLDGRRSAQFEHTLVVTPNGVEVMTLTTGGTCAHDLFV